MTHSLHIMDMSNDTLLEGLGSQDLPLDWVAKPAGSERNFTNYSLISSCSHLAYQYLMVRLSGRISFF